MTFGNRFKFAALSLMVASASALPVRAQEHLPPTHKEGAHTGKSALGMAATVPVANAATGFLMASGFGERDGAIETISEEEGLACLRDTAPHVITLTASAARSLASSSKEFVSVEGRSPSDSGKVVCSLSASILDVQKAHSGVYNVAVNLSYRYGGQSSGNQNTTSLVETLTLEPDTASKKGGTGHDGALVDALSSKDVRYFGTLADAHGNVLFSVSILDSNDY